LFLEENEKEKNAMQRALVCITATSLLTTAAIGAEWPDPNPAPNGDGTNTWYVGNNTQYPIIQHVLDACGDGDEIAVAGGLYVESLSIDNNDVTIRPCCNSDGNWEESSSGTPPRASRMTTTTPCMSPAATILTLVDPACSPNFQTPTS
jgi:hypothetical protein